MSKKTKNRRGPGRPPSPDPLTATLMTRVTPAERAAAERLAGGARNLSDWLRQIVRERLSRPAERR